MSSNLDVTTNRGGAVPRNEFLDLVKGCLIFLVVWGHAIQFLGYGAVSFTSTAEYYAYPVYIGIYSFHMALFMGISGYLAMGAIRKRTFIGFTKVRAIQILLPLFVWSLASYFKGPILSVVKEREFLALPNKLESMQSWGFGSEIWFLWSAFICGAIVSGSQLLGRWRFVGLVAGFVILLLLPQGEVVKLTAFTYPFFVLGCFLAEKRVSEMPPMGVVIGAIAVWCVALFLWEPATYVYVSGMEWRNNLHNLATRFAGGIAGSIVFMAAIWWLSCKWKPKMIIAWGKESLAIYLIQTYLFFPLMGMNHPLRDWKYFGVTAAPVFAIIVCCFSVLFAWLIRRNRYSAFLLFGVPLPSKV